MADWINKETEWMQDEPNGLNLSLRRLHAFPIDESSVFTSLEDALKYVKRDKSDSRRLGKTAYLGQIISVLGVDESGDTTVQVYKVIIGDQETGDLGLALIGESSGGETYVEHSIQIGDRTIPPGATITEALEYVADAFNEFTDGTITSDIVIDSETVVSSGTDVTTAIQEVCDYFSDKIEDISLSTLETSDDIMSDGEVLIPSGTSAEDALSIISDKLAEKGEGIITEDITIGDVTYSAGTDVTEVISAIADDLNAKSDGSIQRDIEVSGVTIVESGTSVTDALQTLVDYLLEQSPEGKVKDILVNGGSVLDENGIAEINFTDSDTIGASISANEVSFNLIRVTNNQYVYNEQTGEFE